MGKKVAFVAYDHHQKIVEWVLNGQLENPVGIPQQTRVVRKVEYVWLLSSIQFGGSAAVSFELFENAAAADQKWNWRA